MGEWKETQIGRLGKVVTGKTPSTAVREHFGGTVPFITPSDMDDRRFISHTARYLTERGAASVAGARIPSGAVMVSCIGSDMGKAAIAGCDAVTNQQINSIVVGEGISNLYVYYNLSTRQAEIRNLGSGGSAVPILNKGCFSQLPFVLPSIEVQQAIAHILGTLDDKIELNRRMNRTLEKMAAAIFKSWFIDFDPVRAKADGRDTGLPAEIADLFPDSFDDSDIGPIPKGWKAKPLPEAIEINPKRTLVKGTLAPFLEMSNMPTRGPSPDAWRLREMGSGMKFVNGDTLVARITPCLENGKTAFVDFLADGEVGWGSTEYIVLRPLGVIPPVFAYLLARTGDFRNFAIQQMTGSSGRQRVPADSLTKYSIVGPEIHSPIFGAFGQIVTPLFRRISAAARQARNLSRMRDTLLPKLMSGEMLNDLGTKDSP